MQAVNRACERCAKRKAKCDGREPCQRCIEGQSPSCIYLAAKKRGPKRKFEEDSSTPTRGEKKKVDEERRTPSVVATYIAGNHYNGVVERDIPADIREHLLDVFQAIVLVSWPVIYTPALTSISSLSRSKPILYSAILLSCTSIAPSQRAASVPMAREVLLNSFTSQLESRGGLGCSEPSISLVQALLFATSYYIGAGKITVAWNHCGHACRMALSMCLHQSNRSAGRRPRGRIEEQEERRTFWGLYIMEQVVSYLLRLPPLLRAEDADREYPDLNEMDEYELWLTEYTQKLLLPEQASIMKGVQTHAISSLIAWIEIMREHESIRKDLKKDVPSGTGAFERLYNDRYQRLHSFKERLPDHLFWNSPLLDASADHKHNFEVSFNQAVDSHRVATPQILLMRAWYSECCMLLHRPCVSEGPEGSFAARQCLCAATEVCAIVKSYEDSFGIELMHAGFVHIIFQSATLFAAMESIEQMYGPRYWRPHLPKFPIAKLFDACFAWLQQLSTRLPFANHYLSILRTLSRARVQNAQPPAALPPHMHNLTSSTDTSAPASPVGLLPTCSYTPVVPPQAASSSSSLAPPQAATTNSADSFWDIVPFDGENLNDWLTSIESFVPM